MSMTVAESRTLPVPPEQAFARTIVEPLDHVFARRFLALPPVRGTDQPVEPWGTVGQARTIRLADGGTMREELTVVEPPSRFDYEITEVTGALKPLVAAIDGRWAFEPVGTGTRVTWSWTMHPRTLLSVPALRLVGAMWHGYARRGLESLEQRLLG